MIWILDTVSVWCGRLFAVLLLLGLVVCGYTALLNRLIKRAGYGGLMIEWAFQECAKDRRRFWARMFWGSKEAS